MQDTHYLQQLVKQQKSGIPSGICSVCSSSPFVIDAAILQAVKTGTSVLIEATANQVNQFGGYTGMKPADFRDHVLSRAAELGLPAERVILGGDHLGPVAWQKQDLRRSISMRACRWAVRSRCPRRKSQTGPSGSAKRPREVLRNTGAA